MKIILNWRRHHYVARVSIFLIMVALIAGMGGCTGGGAIEYDLTISSTAGGSVTDPGEPGPYTYEEGKVVNLVAEAEEGYRFVNWTGDVGTIADVNDATTTITMDANRSIKANFEALPTQYTLTISSTAGGSVTDPGEPGPYTYEEGKVVNLVAEAEEGYRFVNWTGDVGTIADVNNATTTITMNGNYAITASFRTETYYDFVAQASGNRTFWESGTGATGEEAANWTLTFPGATNDNKGFACYRTNVVLEDNRTYDKVLETHPQWVDNGFIRGGYVGLYDMGYKIQTGDRFYAKVGFLKNAAAGNVKFKVWVIVEGAYVVTIAEITDIYDGTLKTIDVDLSPYVTSLKCGFILGVLANGSSGQDWATWVEAKIIR